MSPGFHNRRLEKTENGDMVNHPSDGGASVQQYDAEGFLKTCLARRRAPQALRAIGGVLNT